MYYTISYIFIKEKKNVVRENYTTSQYLMYKIRNNVCTMVKRRKKTFIIVHHTHFGRLLFEQTTRQRQNKIKWIKDKGKKRVCDSMINTWMNARSKKQIHKILCSRQCDTDSFHSILFTSYCCLMLLTVWVFCFFFSFHLSLSLCSKLLFLSSHLAQSVRLFFFCQWIKRKKKMLFLN